MLLAGLLALGACAKRPPDADAIPSGANALALDTPRTDVLDCREDDCADWFRAEVPRKGKLVIDLSATPEEGTDVRIAVSLADGQGATLARDQTIGRTAISVSADVVPATYLIAIASNHPEARFDYTVTARLVLPPAPPKAKAAPVRRRAPVPAKPPPPRFETKRAEVLEVDESGPHGRAVLLDAGSTQGLRVGLRGRLLDGGQPIATLQIVEVYPEGSLARIEGGPGTIGVTTRAEIEIPISP
ncbi:MAG: hypothetical protein WEF50_18245 [Myxococcota bacterium]